MSKTNLASVTHVIFDMDGVILDSENLYFQGIDKVLRKHGSEYTLSLAHKTRGTVAPESARIILAETEIPLSKEDYMKELDMELKEIFNKKIPLLPGAEKLIRHLSANGIPMCVATSSRKSYFDLKSQHHKDLFKLFDFIVTGDMVNEGKPNPEIFIKAMNTFKTSPATPESVLVFEDSKSGVQAAISGGMQVVWVPDNHVDKCSENPSIVIDSLEHFDPLLFQLPGF